MTHHRGSVIFVIELLLEQYTRKNMLSIPHEIRIHAIISM